MLRLLVICFAFSLAGCSGDTKSPPTTTPAAPVAPTKAGGKAHPTME